MVMRNLQEEEITSCVIVMNKTTKVRIKALGGGQDCGEKKW